MVKYRLLIKIIMKKFKILKNITDENGDEIFLIRNNINEDKLYHNIIRKINPDAKEEIFINNENAVGNLKILCELILIMEIIG